MHAAEYYEKVKAAESKLVAARNTIATLGKGEIAVRKKLSWRNYLSSLFVVGKQSEIRTRTLKKGV